MPERTISQTFKVGGVLTNATSAKLSDPTGTYGIRRTDTLATVVADNTSMTNSSTGVYNYTFTALDGVAYLAYIEFVYDGDTIYVEFDIPAVASTSSMVCSYDSLLERVGHELFGIRSGFSADQTVDILQCIKDGLHRVYSAHEWSFFRPLKDISTTAPYATGTVTIAAGVVTLTGGTFPSWAADGILRVSSNYYSISLRNSGTSLTLDDTSVTVAAATAYSLGRPEVPLDDSFMDLTGDRKLMYYPGQNECYPPVCEKHDQAIRTMQQANPYYDRPVFFSIRNVEFDPTVGSRKRLAFHPLPDAAYVLRVPMILRAVMLDETNQYPVGSEQLAQLIVVACLASVEFDFFEKTDGRYGQLFQAMLPQAIATDQERSSPTTLGSDAPRGEGYYSGIGYDYDYARAARIGAIVLDGTTM
jgi:hypothetical protein